ncbi:MAG: agmatine/peptidylarginine deiminase [Bacteroidota bacterium]
MKTFGNRVGIQGLHTYSIVAMISLLLFVYCSDNLEQIVHSPAEFDEQETTFICWNPDFQKTIIALTAEIAKRDHVTLFYNERNQKVEKLRQLFGRYRINLDNIEFAPFNLEQDNVWIRDYGPVFLHDKDGNERVVSFQYIHEFNQEYNMFGEHYSSKMKLAFMRSKMFSEGGGREVNGKGTIILNESYERSINPDLSLAEIENEYRLNLHIKNFIWLKRGIPQDDSFDNGPVLENIYGNGVNGHIDEFCRFADANTILLAQVDPADLQRDPFYELIHQRLEESYDILRNARDQDGKPFKIIRVPQAPVIFDEGQYQGENIYYTPVTSYLNFVLTNNSVVVPSYYGNGDPAYIKEKDESAKRIFQEVFKNRKVVMMNSLDLNYRGGGLHCITSYKPKPKKKKNFLNPFPKG